MSQTPETIFHEKRRVLHTAIAIDRVGSSIINDFSRYADIRPVKAEERLAEKKPGVDAALQAWNGNKTICNLCGVLAAIKTALPEDHEISRNAVTLLKSMPADLKPVGMY